MLSKRDTLRIRVYVTGHDKQDVWNLYSSGYDLSYSLGGGVGGAYRYHGHRQGILGNLGALCIFQPLRYPASACVSISNRKSNLLWLVADFNETLITRDRAIFFLFFLLLLAREATVLSLAEFLFEGENEERYFSK